MQKSFFGQRALAVLTTLVFAALTASATDYYLLGSDASGKSSMNGSGTYGWSTTPGGSKATTSCTAGNNYYVDNGYSLRSPQAAGYTFLGDSLVFLNGQLFHKVNTGTVLTINNLIVAENGYCRYALTIGANTTHIFEGAVSIRAGGLFKSETAEDNRPFYCRANISGPGTLLFGRASSTASQDSLAYLSGDNSGFTGPVIISNRVLGVSFDAASAFPGDSASATADGLKLYATSLVNFEASGTIGPNRGITLADGSASTFAVKANETLTISSQLTGAAGTTLAIGDSTHTGSVRLSAASPDFAGTINVNYGTLYLSGDAVALASKCVKGENGTIVVEGEQSEMTATVTGATGPADGKSYSCTLTVTTPASGYTPKWYDGSAYTLSAAPSYTAEGVYTNVVKVTATGYLDFYGTGVVTVTHYDPPAPVFGNTCLTLPTGSSIAGANSSATFSTLGVSTAFTYALRFRNPASKTTAYSNRYGHLMGAGASNAGGTGGSTGSSLLYKYPSSGSHLPYIELQTWTSGTKAQCLTVLGYSSGNKSWTSAKCDEVLSLEDGEWHTLVVTYDVTANCVGVFLDGVKKYTITSSDLSQYLNYCDKNLSSSQLATPSTTGAFGVGRNSIKSDGFAGSLSEVSVWNRALTDAEATAMFSTHLVGNESGLVLYWPLDGTTGDATAYDRQTNITAHNGTVYSSGTTTCGTYWEELPPSSTNVNWAALYTEAADGDTSPAFAKSGDYTAYYCTVEAAEAMFGSSDVDTLTQYFRDNYDSSKTQVASSTNSVALSASEYAAGQYGFIKYFAGPLTFTDYLGFVFYDNGTEEQFRIFGEDNLLLMDSGMVFDDTESGEVGDWTAPKKSKPGLHIFLY